MWSYTDGAVALSLPQGICPRGIPEGATRRIHDSKGVLYTENSLGRFPSAACLFFAPELSCLGKGPESWRISVETHRREPVREKFAFGKEARAFRFASGRYCCIVAATMCFTWNGSFPGIAWLGSVVALLASGRCVAGAYPGR